MVQILNDSEITEHEQEQNNKGDLESVLMTIIKDNDINNVEISIQIVEENKETIFIELKKHNSQH